MPPIRALWFDAVGTLIHPTPSAPIVYAAVAARLGSQLSASQIKARFLTAFEREEAVDRVLGLRTSEERERERWRHIVAEVLDDVPDFESCFRELYTHFGQPGAWRCEPDVAETLAEAARRGYRLGMASNYDHRLHSVSAGLPALRAIEHVMISSEVGWRKPAAAFFQALCERGGTIPAETLLVGDDRINDFEGAQASGLRAVLLDPRGWHPDVAPRLARLGELWAMM